MNNEVLILKKEDELYCPECGKLVKKDSAFCNYCGVKIKESFKREISSNAKSKATAVILAVFFGYWSWVYTYGRNGFKFWVAFVGAPAVIVTIAHFLNSYGTLFIFLGLAAVWIWAIVDNTVSSDSFYDNYPNG
ncbi:MAG: zinc ribbon domain-containing protein [Actinobacteria bacterium]|nr:zinc ribbon domain-containing protein [Actinomycetota bacterium]